MTLLHFIVDSGSQKKLISVEVIKILKLLMVSCPHSYNIGWLSQGRYIYVSQQCLHSYIINPLKDEVMCDVTLLKFCDVLLGKLYMWKHHVVYESRPHSVIINLGKKLYRIPETFPIIVVSLITTKQFQNVISQTRKFLLFMVHFEGE